MITVKSIEEMTKDIKEKIRVAAINAINRTAFTARKNAIENVKANFTLRNNFTQKSIHTTPCRSSAKLNNIKATTGALERAQYMARQETGGMKKSPTGKNLIIPTTLTRGGKNQNTVRKNFRYSAVIAKTAKPKNSTKTAFVAAAAAAAKTKGFVRLNNAFFRVTNFRKTKSGIKFRLKEALNLKHNTTYTPAKPWLLPAAQNATNLTQTFFNEEMDKLSQ